MKKNIFVIITSIVMFSCNDEIYSPLVKTNNNYEKHSYRVYKIDSIGNYYLLYLNRGERNYKVVSEKTDNISCKKRIKVNRKYELELGSIWDMFFGTDFASGHKIGGIEFPGKTVIYVERENSILILHYAKNIKGLCIVKEYNEVKFW
jgi:hypothetical protein